MTDIDFSELKLGEVLERDAFGVVKQATYKGQVVVVKLIEGAEKEPKLYEMFRYELEILLSLDHPNIVKCLGGCTIPPNLCIVTEYCNGGPLYDLLHNKERNKKLSTQQQLEIALKIAEGMEYLHTHKPMVVHRDLKSSNILLHNGIPKITGFDVATTMDELTEQLDEAVGTYNWMAPEVMRNEPYNEKVDVWSFGMVLYELTTNTIPYENCKNNIPFLVHEVVINKKTPPIPNDREIHPTLHELMKQCWNSDPQQRPSFSQIVQTFKNV